MKITLKWTLIKGDAIVCNICLKKYILPLKFNIGSGFKIYPRISPQIIKGNQYIIFDYAWIKSVKSNK